MLAIITFDVNKYKSKVLYLMTLIFSQSSGFMDKIEPSFNDLFVVNKNRILKNERILLKSFIPKKIVARDDQIRDIALDLSPIVRGGQPGNIYASGDSGVGKTIVIRYILKILIDGLKERGDDIYLEFVTIDCAKTRSEIPILISILGQLTHKPAKQGRQNYQYYEDIWDAINARASEHQSYTLVLFLDDVHLFESPDSILFEFSRALSNHDVKTDNATVGVILASNQRGYLLNLSESVRSSCSFHYYDFPDYNEEELYKILQLQKEAFIDGAMPDDVLAACAKLVAERYHGDARRAIDIIHEAAKAATLENTTQIKLQHIENAEIRVNDKITLEVLKKITLHDQLLMLSIHISNKVIQAVSAQALSNAGVVFDVYRTICKILNQRSNGENYLSTRLTALSCKHVINAEQIKGFGNTRFMWLTDDVEAVIEDLFEPHDLKKIQNNYYDLESLIITKLHNQRQKHQ
jgi:archaeal cell division control protein 6